MKWRTRHDLKVLIERLLDNDALIAMAWPVFRHALLLRSFGGIFSAFREISLLEYIGDLRVI